MTMKELLIYIEGYKIKYKLNNDLADRRTARICMILANINRDSKRRKKPYSEEDFIPKPKKKMTVEQMELLLKAITMSLGGEVET